MKLYRPVLKLPVFLAVALLAASYVRAQVVINEIMYRPAPAIPENPAAEWVELHNSGNQTVDLSGWKLSKAVQFTFTNVALAPGNFLVVAGGLNQFRTLYPQVTNVIGTWTGKLGNNGDELELVNAAGQKMDSVGYANEGDWAERRASDPYPGHPEWWAGWKWVSAADGGGASLELVNPRLANQHGQSWAASRASGGTPGAPNSVLTNGIPPLILDVRHLPAVPRSTNQVIVSARITPALSGVSAVSLFYRVDGSSTFESKSMVDDGAHGDGLAGDGVYGAVLPAQADKTVVEFYVRAADLTGLARTWPGPTDESGTQGANALYQVDDFDYAGTQPVYRFITAAREWDQWVNLMDNVPNGRYSNARMNGALVRVDSTGTETRYRISLRNRGAGTRSARPHNLSLGIPGDQDLGGIRRLDFNTRTLHSQVAANALFSAAGLLNAYGAPVQVRINGRNLANASPDGRVDSFQFGSYYCFEPYTSDWGSHHVPQDPNGNIYKGVWYLDWVNLARGATLDYLGPDPAEYRLAYSPTGPAYDSGPYGKESNQAEDDWSDLIGLTRALSTTPDADYVGAVEKVVNVNQWLRHIATHSLLSNMETTLATGTGDDYSSYSGMVDRRFQLLPHDLDTTLGAGDNAPDYGRSIFRAANMPALDRLLKHPDFVPLYFSNLLDLAATTFSPSQVGALLDQQLGAWVPADTIEGLKLAAEIRRTNVLAQVPVALTATSTLPVTQGFPRTTNPTIEVSGRANAARTRAVKVNGQAAVYTAWQGSWTISQLTLRPGVNRVLIEAFDAAGVVCDSLDFNVWYDTGTTRRVDGTISGAVTWEAKDGPFEIANGLTVAGGATLRIAPGTSVYLGSGARLTVASGGVLLAEGTAAAPIRFGTKPGSGDLWGGMILEGVSGSPESRIAHAIFEGNGNTCIEVAGGTLYLGQSCFQTTTHPYLSLDGSSFFIEECHFPSASDEFELVHGTQGIKAGGRGIFRKCFFGATTGYKDVIDFTGGNRDAGEPIIQVYECVFAGSGDDELDLDGTDAWIEGNIFLNVHRNGSPDSSSAVSGGSDSGRTSEVTVLRNLFFNCDHAATAKQGNFYTLLQNTVVRVTRDGGVDDGSGVINLQDTEPSITTYGRGVYLEGNIVVDAEALTRHYDPAQSIVTFTNNTLPFLWSGPGGGNLVADPRLSKIPSLEEVRFRTWEEAQILWAWLKPREDSPVIGRGLAGLDQGAVVPAGLMVSGKPEAVSASGSVRLVLGPWHSDFGVLCPGFPAGSGFTHYRWRLDGGTWSEEMPIGAALSLTGLAEGQHRLELTGKRDSGLYQDARELGPEGKTTQIRWTVDTTSRRVLLNEILADNQGAVTFDDSSPDLIELRNAGAMPVDLSGMSLTDSAAEPRRYVFPSGSTLVAGGYLVLAAEALPSTNRLGFAFSKSGGQILLFDSPTRGGALVDEVRYGAQLPDLSIGRLPAGGWGLMTPSFGGSNGMPMPTADPGAVRINEWLASSALGPDFIELYNPEPSPVDVGNCFLSDVPWGFPARSPIPPLTFIPAGGFLVMTADGQDAPLHTQFQLAAEWGALGLFSPTLTTIDQVLYGPQRAEVSTGRTPDGGADIAEFDVPTPGSGNPQTHGYYTVTNITVNLLNFEQVWSYNQTNNLDGIAWMDPGYDDASWLSGPGLLAYESDTSIVPLIRTVLEDPRKATTEARAGHAVYFRTWLTVTNDLAAATLNIRMRVDDGAVIYFNGTEVRRHRMRTSEVITNMSFATGTPSSGDAVADETFTLPGSLLKPGVNLVAVEVHQTSATSTDIAWAMGLSAITSVTNWTALDVKFNEVFANNRGASVADWVELHNPGASTVDLAGLSIRTGSGESWSFPTGATLPSGAFLVVQCDPDSAATTNTGSILNTGFGLDADGEKLFLYDGTKLVDAVSFGPQAAHFSLSRYPDGKGDWRLCLPTPGETAVVVQTADPSSLRINEWMSDPSGGDDWFEICNLSSQPVALGGLGLTDDLNRPRQFVIPPLSFIGTGPNGAFQVFQADGNTGNGPDHTSFKLSGAGESLGLFSADGANRLDAVTFGGQEEGISEGRFPDGSPTIRRFPHSATPGAPNFIALLDVLVNEVSADPLAATRAIELFNQGSQTHDLSGAWLSDDPQAPKKYRLPDPAILPASTAWVIDETQFAPGAGAFPGFVLNRGAGGSVYLSLADASGELTGYRASLRYRPVAAGLTAGLHETSTGFQSAALVLPTFGSENSMPATGPVVISEIHYHPADGGTNENLVEEFVELANITGSAVDLYDTQAPTNRWEMAGGLKYAFPTGTTLPPSGRVLLVSFDPLLLPAEAEAFRLKFAVPSEVPLLGPFQGKLNNGGEHLELNRPAIIPGGGLVRLVADEVDYRDRAPWASAADGTGGGLSLQRRSLGDFGNDPVNWVAASPTAGGENRPAAGSPPVVTSQPGSAALPAGGNAAFTAAATGAAPLVFQWRFQGMDLPGETNATLTLSGVAASDEGRYSARVSNAYGCAVSSNALLVIQAPPTFTRQPLGAVANGNPWTLAAVAHGTAPLHYQWLKNGLPVAGADQATLSFTNLQAADAGAYTLRVSNTFGAVTSVVATVSLALDDSDGDGIPDNWMVQQFGHPTGQSADESKAGDDPDLDGMTNLEEFRAGTLPLNPASALTLSATTLTDAVQLRFLALANRGYTVQQRSTLAATWVDFVSIPPGASRFVSVDLDPRSSDQHFYRLVTWQQESADTP